MIRGALLDDLLQRFFCCRADVLHQVMLSQHQQLSVHVGDDAGPSDSLLQRCRFPKRLILAVCHDFQPHLLRPRIEECVAGGVCCSLACWQQAAGWGAGSGPAHWHLFKGCLLITAGTRHYDAVNRITGTAQLDVCAMTTAEAATDQDCKAEITLSELCMYLLANHSHECSCFST